MNPPSFVVSVHVYWMPLGNSPTYLYVLFLEIFKMNFPFLLGDRPCDLSFVGWKLCMKYNEMTYNGPSLQARPWAGTVVRAHSGAGKQSITAEKQWPWSESGSWRPHDATTKMISRIPHTRGLLSSPTCQLDDLGQISHPLCASQAIRSKWVNVHRGIKTVPGILRNLWVCYPYFFHLGYNEFLGFLCRYVTHIIIPSLLQW